MNITLFGASGGIGSLLTSYALNCGDTVTAHVRNPEKINQRHSNLNIVAGELTDMNSMEKAIAIADVVISTLGPSMKKPEDAMATPIANGHSNIIKALEELGKKRFVTLATPSVNAKEDKNSFATRFPGFVAKLFLPSAYRDIVKTGEIIKASHLDWTVVRIISPNAKDNGKGYAYTFGDTKAKMSVSRQNVAAFMYDVANDPKYIHRMPIVYNI